MMWNRISSMWLMGVTAHSVVLISALSMFCDSYDYFNEMLGLMWALTCISVVIMQILIVMLKNMMSNVQ